MNRLSSNREAIIFSKKGRTELIVDNIAYDINAVGTGANQTTSITVDPFTKTITFKEIRLIALVKTLLFLFAVVSIAFARRLCAAFEKCNTPFGVDVIKNMRAFAFSIIPWAFISSLPGMLSDYIYGNRISITYSVNIVVVAMVFAILGITYVFKYGAVLQQESDETL